MPAPKAKSAAPSGAAPKAKVEKSTASTNGTTTPVTDVSGAAPASGLGKPDKAAHDAEQDSIKKEIDAAQAKLVRGAKFAMLRGCIDSCYYVCSRRSRRRSAVPARAALATRGGMSCARS